MRARDQSSQVLLPWDRPLARERSRSARRSGSRPARTLSGSRDRKLLRSDRAESRRGDSAGVDLSPAGCSSRRLLGCVLQETVMLFTCAADLANFLF